MRLGDHLRVHRQIYYHHGILVENDRVIHFAGPPDAEGSLELLLLLGAESAVGTVHETSLECFRQAGRVEAVEYGIEEAYPPLKTVARARSKLGQKGYKLWANNCEHFATWCRTGFHQSHQASRLGKVFRSLAAGFTARVAVEEIAIAAGLGAAAGPVGVGAAVLIAAIPWFVDRKRPLKPVFQEFVDYATALYSLGPFKYPFGGSFRHSGQLDGKVSLRVFPGREDLLVLFVYRGGFFDFDSRNDWFVTERAIIWPAREVYLSLHEVADIRAGAGGIKVVDLAGGVTRLPSRFIRAASVAAFLKTAVAGTAFDVRLMQRNWLSAFKDALSGVFGTAVISSIVAFFNPVVAAWFAAIGVVAVLFAVGRRERKN